MVRNAGLAALINALSPRGNCSTLNQKGVITMKQLNHGTLESIEGGGWCFACGFGAIASAASFPLGLLMWGPGAAGACYCCVSGC